MPDNVQCLEVEIMCCKIISIMNLPAPYLLHRQIFINKQLELQNSAYMMIMIIEFLFFHDETCMHGIELKWYSPGHHS